ncbi:TPA: VanZ family protein [Bacillus cereus]
MLDFKIPFLLVFIIYSIYLIKTFKKKTLFKNFVEVTFVVYITCLISITLFPIPIDKMTIYYAKETSYLQNNFIPLHFLNNFSMYPSLGNFILLFPLGFYLPLINIKLKSYKELFIFAFFSSLSIELIQFLISWLAGFTYRTTDIDDLILNTLGALFGYFIFKILSNVFENLFQINIFNLLKKESN